jgi:hypothetical protein
MKTYPTSVKVSGGYCQAVTCGTYIKAIDRSAVYATPDEAMAKAAHHLEIAERLCARRHRHARLYAISVMGAIPIVIIFTALTLWGGVETHMRFIYAAIAIGPLLVLGVVSSRRYIPEDIMQYLNARKVSPF